MRETKQNWFKTILRESKPFKLIKKERNTSTNYSNLARAMSFFMILLLSVTIVCAGNVTMEAGDFDIDGKLDVGGDTNITGDLITQGTLKISTSNAPAYFQIDNGVQNWNWIADNSPNFLGLHDGTRYRITFGTDYLEFRDDTDVFTFENGNLGIGMDTAPEEKLVVVGNANITNDLTVNGDIVCEGVYRSSFLDRAMLWGDANGVYIRSQDNNVADGIFFEDYYGVRLVNINDLTGNVLIGKSTAVPKYKLEVLGNSSINNTLFVESGEVKVLGSLNTTGNITATSFIGDGSQLTGIDTGGNPFDQSLNTTDSPSFTGLTINGNANATGNITHHGGQIIHGYVPRDATTVDFVGDDGGQDFISDGQWQVDGLNLSSIVPEGAKAVHLQIIVNDGGVGSKIQIRQNSVNIYNRLRAKVFVANQDNEITGIIQVDSDRKLDYAATNVDFESMVVIVLGWYI